MRLVDLSHVIDHHMASYPGLPGPIGTTAFSDVAVTGSAVLLRTGWNRHLG